LLHDDHQNITYTFVHARRTHQCMPWDYSMHALGLINCTAVKPVLFMWS